MVKVFLCPRCEKPMAKLRSYDIHRCTPCNYQYDTWGQCSTGPEVPRQVDVDTAPPEHVPWSDAVVFNPRTGEVSHGAERLESALAGEDER